MRIVADDRESAGGVIPFLLNLPDTDVCVRRLPLGDYLADNALLFERKTLSDLAVSLVDGRLLRQAGRLARSQYRPVLILEGGIGELAVLGVRREALQGALIAVSVVFGVPLLRSLDAEETARLIAYAAAQFGRHTRGMSRRPGYRPKGLSRRRAFILQGLPGIGPAKAQRLLDVFGSVRAVLNAEPDRLREVDGIGARTAEAIRGLVSEDRAPYGRRSRADWPI